MRILAIDDKAMPRKVLVRAINEASPTSDVVSCGSAAETLALPDLDQFDVAFVDVDMPGMNGIELARELKRHNPRINIVFATGYDEYMAEAFAMHSSGYLTKPITAADVATELENLRFPQLHRDTNKLVVRCFGDFEVFAQGKAVAFKRGKTKELLAFLVDRRGAVVGMHETEAVLWEDSSHAGKTSGSYLRTLAADLKRSLDACGHGDVIVKRYGAIGIDMTKVTCDYYAFLEGDPIAINSWNGEYMNQYSWAETTKAALLR
ncbi:MAG: response regulator [Coriobacteriia bacterium]|nr:response regulator [Coriobacteriia bacterium]